MKAIAVIAAVFFTVMPTLQAQQSSSSGLDLKAIDTTVNPCQDFYQYACGNWDKANPIPADESSWGRFNELDDRIQTTLHQILERAEKNQQSSSIDQKIGGFYQSCMDLPEIEKRGVRPAEPELDRIAKIQSPADLVDETARLHQLQVDVFFAFGSGPDPTNSRENLADLDQGGILLPERDYYFRDDAESKKLRQEYVAHISRLLVLAGEDRTAADKDAATVMSVETALAKASLDVTSRRDPELLVHKMSLDQLAAISPRFNFSQFFEHVKTPSFKTLNVDVPDFVKGLNTMLKTQSLDNLKIYLKWQYLHSSAPLMSKAFVDENFTFFGRILYGQSEQRPRWKRCVSRVDDELGEALGRKFVEETFGKEGKERTLQMVHEIEHQMSLDIESIDWMSPETKQRALQKLHAVADKIGYPEKWRDYSSIEIKDNDYFGNDYRANLFESKRQRDKIGKPVDRGEWSMTPPTVNAYYDPTQNNINFPAGILQPPFYSNKADDAVNYGAIGAIVGHELTHGFDDEGRKFDAEGNLTDWWKKTDADRYEQLSSCFVEQYGKFNVVPGVNVNGKLTLGENTADNGGVRLAYRALLDKLAALTIPVSQETDGYTQPQQFFLGFAQVWCGQRKPERARELAQTDPHSPDRFRVNGVMANSPEFGKAFGCKAGDTLYAAKPCRVW